MPVRWRMVSVDAQSRCGAGAGSLSAGPVRAFVVVYAEGSFPIALGVGTAEWTRLEALTAGRAVPFRKISYQHLHALASAAASQGDRRVLADLSEWMGRKLTAALAKGES